MVGIRTALHSKSYIRSRLPDPLNHGVEYFSYGFGLSDDARWGQPHWSRGWRASFEAERYDKSIPALAFNDAHTDARSFTRLIYHARNRHVVRT